jgi:hypothetical protein
MTDDIVTRLRGWRRLHLARIGELFDEAADEITRLWGDAEIARLRLEAARKEVTGNTQEPVTRGGVPVAWAAVGKNGQPMWLSYSRPDAEGAVVGMVEVVPLYRSPTLTDEERAFLELHAQRLVGWSRSSDDSKRELVTVRGLLERMGSERLH